MAKITYIGEDSLHVKEDGSGQGPRFTTAYGKKFEKDKPVTITDRSIIKRAIGNAFFEVELTDIEQDEMMPEPADETPEPETRPVRRPPGRPPKVKPDAIDSNAA
jgi:hypothetical protein